MREGGGRGRAGAPIADHADPDARRDEAADRRQTANQPGTACDHRNIGTAEPLVLYHVAQRALQDLGAAVVEWLASAGSRITKELIRRAARHEGGDRLAEHDRNAGSAYC